MHGGYLTFKLSFRDLARVQRLTQVTWAVTGRDDKVGLQAPGQPRHPLGRIPNQAHRFAGRVEAPQAAGQAAKRRLGRLAAPGLGARPCPPARLLRVSRGGRRGRHHGAGRSRWRRYVEAQHAQPPAVAGPHGQSGPVAVLLLGRGVCAQNPLVPLPDA